MGGIKLTEANMHGNADTTFDTSANVVAIPGDTLGNVGIDSHGEEETSGILDMGVLRSEQHDQTDNGDETEADHENASGLESVSCPSTCEGAETGNDVWGDGH